MSPEIPNNGGKTPSGFGGGGEFLRILRRRKKIIAATLGAVLAIAGLFLFFTTPLYTASATLMLDPEESEVLGMAEPTVNVAQEEARLATEVELVESRGLARQVVRDLALYDDDEFNPGHDGKPQGISAWFQDITGSKPAAKLQTKQLNPAQQAELIENITDKLRERIKVERVEKTQLINISVSSSSPEKAARIVDKLASNHIANKVAQKRRSNERAVVALTKRVDELRTQLVGADQSVASYRTSRGLFDTGGANASLAEMDRLASQLAEASASRAEVEARVGSLNAGAVGTSTTAATSPLLNDLRGQETTLRRRIAELTGFYGNGHPDVINATAQLAEVQKRVAEEEARVRTDNASQLSANRAREGELAGALGAVRSRSLSQETAAVGLMDLERNADTSRQLYVALLARLKELTGQGQNIKARVSVLAKATIPDTPTYPLPRRILSVALLGGLMLALIIAFTVEAFDSRIRTADQLERLLGLPTLSMVPELPKKWSRWPAYASVLDRPSSAFSEAVRDLYMEIASRKARQSSQVVVISSPLPGDGKTTTAASIAAAAAVIGHEAVVVDLDLRRPNLDTAMGRVASGPDVVDYLEGEARLDEIIVRDDRIPRLATISVREPAIDPGTLLASTRIEDLLRELKARFELVVIDAPPILPVRDAKTLSEFADITLMVVRWGSTKPEAARAAFQLFDNRVTGVVLNRVDYKRHARAAYGDAIEHYAQYSAYYREEAGAPTRTRRNPDSVSPRRGVDERTAA